MFATQKKTNKITGTYLKLRCGMLFPVFFPSYFASFSKLKSIVVANTVSD